jgi:long-chain acyl-CoA synthetase
MNASGAAVSDWYAGETGVLGEGRGDSGGFSTVREILAKQTDRPAHAISPNMHLLLDLGIDSIGKMDVLGTVEAQFGVRIDDETGAKIARVSDLLKVVGDRMPRAGQARGKAPRQKPVAEPSTAVYTDGPLPAALVPARWLLRGSVATFMNTYIRVRAKGRENIPSTGAFILAPNHSSHLDSPSVLAAAGGKRRVWVAGAEDYFFNTRLKRLVFGKFLDTIPFDRHGDGVVGLRRCGEAIGRGDGLLIFPEGTRSTTGRLQPFKIGVAVLAVERKAPIIPVYIDRAFDLFSKGERFIKPGTITVTFGRPIHPPEIVEQTDRYAVFQALAQQVEAAVATLADEASA